MSVELFQLSQQNNILKQNVHDLQKQLNAAQVRIKELLEEKKPPVTEEELVRKVMVARGLDPDVAGDIKEFWRDYHGIEDE